jgi:chromosome segregation ATPase
MAIADSGDAPAGSQKEGRSLTPARSKMTMSIERTPRQAQRYTSQASELLQRIVSSLEQDSNEVGSEPLLRTALEKSEARYERSELQLEILEGKMETMREKIEELKNQNREQHVRVLILEARLGSLNVRKKEYWKIGWKTTNYLQT